jgi:hypothetical protein
MQTFDLCVPQNLDWWVVKTLYQLISSFYRRVRLAAETPGLVQAKLLACLGFYLSAAALSLVFAHVMLVVRPHSDLGDRIIVPVVRALQFIDGHWKAVLILTAPFFVPIARDLLPRLRKVWGVEFYGIEIETEGVHEKPVQANPGAMQ